MVTVLMVLGLVVAVVVRTVEVNLVIGVINIAALLVRLGAMVPGCR